MITTTHPKADSPLKRLYLQPAFVAAAIVLGVAALGLNAATQALKVHFKKEAVPLRQKLDDPLAGIPSKLGPWLKVSEQVSLNPDVQETLATDQFVFRHYADTRIVPAARLAALEGKDEATQQRMLSIIAAEHPNSVISLAVTYYTGSADRVSHIPERCLTAGGYTPVEPPLVVNDARATFAMPDGSSRVAPFRFLSFEDQTGSGQVPTRVGYFFNCNGGYVDDPNEVRFKLQDLFERHGYYAKLELTVRDFRRRAQGEPSAHRPEETAATIDAMRDLISAVLPDVERCLPDWKAVSGADANATATK